MPQQPEPVPTSVPPRPRHPAGGPPLLFVVPAAEPGSDSAHTSLADSAARHPSRVGALLQRVRSRLVDLGAGLVDEPTGVPDPGVSHPWPVRFPDDVA